MNDMKMRPITDEDVSLMQKWLYEEHVAKWYEHPEVWLQEIQGRAHEFLFIQHRITYVGNMPIGFCQYYLCSEADEDWYGSIPIEGTYSIDYLIGEKNFLGKGYGKETIKLLENEIFSLSGAERIIVQPELENEASCATLLACGYAYDKENRLFFKTKPNN